MRPYGTPYTGGNEMELKDLKAGDKVVVNYGYYANRAVKEIEKVTPAGFIKVDGDLYTLSGSMRGGKWGNRKHIRVATTELIQEIADENLIKNTLWYINNLKNLTVEQARAIAAILTEDVKPKSGTELIHGGGE
jgi:hypothetical protein